MHTDTATRQGGHNVKRPATSADFSAWLRPRMLAAGLSQTDLRKRLEDVGIEAGKQTVSQWYNGGNTPVPDTVVVIAQILGAPPAEALRRAGHTRVAELLDRTAQEHPPAEQPMDPVIEKILNDPNLPSDLKDRAIAFYRRRMQQATQDLQDFGIAGT